MERDRGDSTVGVGLDGAVRSNTLPVSFDCRHGRQSFYFTFRDADDTVSAAAAAAPFSRLHLDGATQNESESYEQDEKREHPVLLTLAGVGVTARAAVDSHKYRLSPEDLAALPAAASADAESGDEQNEKKGGKGGKNKKDALPDTVYGLASGWTLAPQRNGAHNWEGQGFLSAL